jgi:hypothetical protein
MWSGVAWAWWGPTQGGFHACNINGDNTRLTLWWGIHRECPYTIHVMVPTSLFFFFFFFLLFIFYILDFVLFIRGIYVMSILNDRTMYIYIYIYIKFNLNYKMSVQLV